MSRILLIIGLTASLNAFAGDSLLRIACDEESAGAEVSINGKFKGECPIDLSLPEGTHQITVIKRVDDEKYRTFNQALRLGDGVVKRIDVVLGATQLTALGKEKESERKRLDGERIRQEEERLAEIRRNELEQKRLAEENAKRREFERQNHMAELRRRQLEQNSAKLQELASRGITPGDGKTFKDCDECPEMVLIPPGKFIMGSNGEAASSPAHEVSIDYPFAVSKYEVTQGVWKAIMGSNPSYYSGTWPFSRDGNPVENVSWVDANSFTARLSTLTGKRYRLLSEAEWEYSCRGGQYNRFCGSDAFQNVISHSYSDYHKDVDSWDSRSFWDRYRNGYGLVLMSGNVEEWVLDCWNDNYRNTPTDGSPALTGNCGYRVLRGGGHDHDLPQKPELIKKMQATWRNSANQSYKHKYVGFRVAVEISPSLLKDMPQ